MACSIRTSLLTIYVLELILTGWKQVFDYLGFMWGPIIFNFLNVIFLIFGFFGAWQLKAGYITTCLFWTVFWCGWNIFLICFFLNVGSLNREWDLLSLGTGSVSWWELHGPGCKVLFLANQTSVESNDPWRPARPDLITGCYIPYHILETVQASVHIVLTSLSLYLGLTLSTIIRNGKQPSGGSASKLNKVTMPSLYAAEYISSRVNNPEPGSGGESDLDLEPGGSGGAAGRARPMTPRRVKRRSGHSRESGPGGSGLGTLGRASARRHGHRSSGRRAQPQRPASYHPSTSASAMGHTNLMYQSSSTGSLAVEGAERPGSARSSYSNFHGTRAYSYRQSGRKFLAAGPPAYTSQSETGV